MEELLVLLLICELFKSFQDNSELACPKLCTKDAYCELKWFGGAMVLFFGTITLPHHTYRDFEEQLVTFEDKINALKEYKLMA